MKEIIYPTQWEYTIFCTDKDLLQNALNSRFCGLKYTLTDSKKSANYSSHHFKINVLNEAQRNEIFEFLREIECVKFVL
ncbi:HP0495 family protein [Helicobacter sp. 23-1044]